MTNEKKTYSERLRQYRDENGTKQRDLAKILGVPLGTLRDWEQGRYTPPGYVQRMVERSLELEELRREERETAWEYYGFHGERGA